MAMIILTLIAIPVGYMIGQQVQGTISSGDLTIAGNAARSEMERLNNTAYASVATGSSTINSMIVNWTVTTVTGSNGAERKDIVLTAKRSGTSAVLATLYGSIAKDVTYAP